MGLTNDPNIPVPALANESETQDLETQDSREDEENLEQETENEIMNELLIALGLEEGATPEAALAKITELQTAANDATERVTELETANDKITELETAANDAAGKVTTLEASLGIAANHAVQVAVTTGRLTPAEAEAKATEILAANDFAAALQDLGKLPAKVKTESKIGDLGNSKTRLVVAANDESKAARAERAELVANEYERTNPTLSEGERKRIAWQRASAKHPALFGKESSGPAA